MELPQQGARAFLERRLTYDSLDNRVPRPQDTSRSVRVASDRRSSRFTVALPIKRNVLHDEEKGFDTENSRPEGRGSLSQLLLNIAFTTWPSDGENGDLISLVVKDEKLNNTQGLMSCQTQWRHVQTESMTFSSFYSHVATFPNLQDGDLTLIKRLLDDVRQTREKEFVHGRYLRPLTLVYDGENLDESTTLQRTATFVSLPIFTLQNLTEYTSTGADDVHPVRSLLQSRHRLESTKSRDIEQAITKISPRKGDSMSTMGGLVHVPQVWALIFNQYIITYAPLDVSLLLGDSIKLVPYAHAFEDDSILSIHFTDTQGNVSYIPLRTAKTWFVLVKHVSDIVNFDEDNLVRDQLLNNGPMFKIVTRDDVPVTAESWPMTLEEHRGDIIQLKLVDNQGRFGRHLVTYYDSDYSEIDLSNKPTALKSMSNNERASELLDVRDPPISITEEADIVVPALKELRSCRARLREVVEQQKSIEVDKLKSDIIPVIEDRILRLLSEMTDSTTTNRERTIYEAEYHGDHELRYKSSAQAPKNFASSRNSESRIRPGSRGDFKGTYRPKSKSSMKSRSTLGSVSKVTHSHGAVSSPARSNLSKSSRESSDDERKASPIQRIGSTDDEVQSTVSSIDDTRADVVRVPSAESAPKSRLAKSSSYDLEYESYDGASRLYSPEKEQAYYSYSPSKRTLARSRRSLIRFQKLLHILPRLQDDHDTDIQFAPKLKRMITPIKEVLPLPYGRSFSGVAEASRLPLAPCPPDTPIFVWSPQPTASKHADKYTAGPPIEEPLSIKSIPRKPGQGIDQVVSQPTSEEVLLYTLTTEIDTKLRDYTKSSPAYVEVYENIIDKTYDEIAEFVNAANVEGVTSSTQTSGSSHKLHSDNSSGHAEEALALKLRILGSANKTLLALFPEDYKAALVSKYWGALYMLFNVLNASALNYLDVRLTKICDLLRNIHLGVRTNVRGTRGRYRIPRALPTAFQQLLKCFIVGLSIDDWSSKSCWREFRIAFNDCEDLLVKGRKQLLLTLGLVGHREPAAFQAVEPEAILALILTNLVDNLFVSHAGAKSQLTSELLGEPQLATTQAGLSPTPSEILQHDIQLAEVYREYSVEMKSIVRDQASVKVYDNIQLLEEELQAIHAILRQQADVLQGFKSAITTSGKPNRSAGPIDRSLARIQQRIYDFYEPKREAATARDLASQYISLKAESNNKAIVVFTIVTIIFLPLSFVTSYLGMNTSDLRNMASGQTLFWATGVPVAFLVLSVALLAGYYGPKVYDASTARLAERARMKRRKAN